MDVPPKGVSERERDSVAAMVVPNLGGIAAHELIGLACQQLSTAQLTLEVAAEMAKHGRGYTMEGARLAHEIQTLAAKVEQLGCETMQVDNAEIDEAV